MLISVPIMYNVLLMTVHIFSICSNCSSTPRKRKKESTGGGGERPTPASSSSGAAVEPDSSGAPPSKKRKNPLCKYGAKCYQTGARHREQFGHPWHEAGTHRLECADIKVEEVR